METPTHITGLREFCRALPELRGDASRQGWIGLLRRVERELREGTRPADEVVAAFWRELGLVSTPRGFAALPGQDPAPPEAGWHTCPRGLCTRAERRAAGDQLPECNLFEVPMVLG